MAGMYWSLRNKLEDVERALALGQNASARMAAHELGIRLSHMLAALRLQTEGGYQARLIEPNDRLLQEAHTRFDETLNRLLFLLKDKQELRAVEVVRRMFELLDELDRNSAHGPFTDIPRTDEE